MSLIDFIEKLQNKPRRVRLRILWSSVIVIMLFVVSVWAFSLKSSLEDLAQKSTGIKKQSSSIVEDIKEDVPSFFKALKATVGSLFEGENNGDSKSAKPETPETDPVTSPEIEIKPTVNDNETAKPIKLPIE